MNKNIVISGSYGNGNTGDESILLSMIKEIRSINKDINITVLSKNPSDTAKLYQVNSLHTFNIIKIIILFIKSDLFISGGGTLLQNMSSKRSLIYYLWTLLTAKICKCKVIMYGCGIGPINGKISRKLTSFIVDKYVDDILLRDSLSYEELTKLKIKMNKVDIGLDPSMQINKYISVDSDIFNKLNISKSKKYVGICLNRYSSSSIKELIKTINYLNTLEYLPILIPMNYNEDLNILKQLGSQLNIRYHIIDEYLDITSKYSLISKMNLVITSRLHGVVYSYLNNVKVIGISYDKKLDIFCEEYGINSYIKHIDFNYESFLNIFNNLKETNINNNKINSLKKKNIEFLKKYIK